MDVAASPYTAMAQKKPNNPGKPAGDVGQAGKWQNRGMTGRVGGVQWHH